MDEIKKYSSNSSEYMECEFRINNIKKELDFNLIKLNETIDKMLIN